MKFFEYIKEILVVYVIQYLLIIISSFIAFKLGYNISIFINNEFYYILLTFNIILSIYLIIKYKTKESKIDPKGLISSIFIVIAIAIILNMLFFLSGLQTSGTISNKLLLLIITSGLLGPIVEEYLFRKILLTRLLKNYSKIKSILIASIIFAVFHTSLNGLIYAFILGVILSYIYLKYNNIKIPIICHMISNIIILFLTDFNMLILSISIILLVIGLNIMINKKL